MQTPQTSSNIGGVTDPKCKNLMKPPDYLMSFPTPQGLVNQEETWNMGLDTCNDDAWEETMDNNVSEFGYIAGTTSGGCLADVPWEQIAARITETGINWPSCDDNTPMDYLLNLPLFKS
ncbi:hypothetical protein IGI04_004353 [Brassica rapa subsp. trilocularis]|uniref:Uncharacterized protein n=2 Tax=Brassica campestris TaxID=3711 RepID=M4EJ56_BRACM|nr:hypothetical protein IGI04_004353 [Brassica rapa subsp. trilocularis]